MATQGAFALVQREFEARRCSDAKVEGPAATFTEQIQATKYATQATPQHKLAVALHRRAIESLATGKRRAGIGTQAALLTPCPVCMLRNGTYI